MTVEDRAILKTAQKKAVKTLAASREEADRLVSQAEAAAESLLVEQQERADNLIEQTREDGTDPAEDADALLESDREAAEVLAATEEGRAEKLSEATKDEAVDVLMTGQREGAAILLESWMHVTEKRPPAGKRSS